MMTISAVRTTLDHASRHRGDSVSRNKELDSESVGASELPAASSRAVDTAPARSHAVDSRGVDTAPARKHASSTRLRGVMALGLALGATTVAAEAGVRAAPAAARLPSVALGGMLQTGEVAITEFMKDPAAVSDARGEWIEVRNNLPWRVNLEGWVLADDSGSTHVIANGGNGVRVRPGRSIVLGIESDPALNGGVLVDYEYTGFSLGNGADSIILMRPNGLMVDRVAWDDGILWPDLPGRSIQVRNEARFAVLNDDASLWCHGTTPLSAVNPDTGTPGADNDACP